MPTNINIYHDPRTQGEAVVYGFTLARESLYDYERDLRMGSGRLDDNFTHLLGNRLVSMGYSGPVFQAWLDTRDDGLTHDGMRCDLSNPRHQSGMCMLAMPEHASEMYQSLIGLDNRCRVRFEAMYNNMDMSVNMYVHITVPQTVLYGRNVAYNEPRRAESSVSLTRRQDFMDFEFGGMRQQMVSGRPTTGITLGGVDLGEFRDTPINVEANALSAAERENIRQEAEALSKQQRKQQLERQQAILRADEALKKPQGTLAPRKTKRVSVAIEAPSLEAESPRRMKIRRDREN